MKTLHTAYRVTDLAASLGLYSALGYREVGRVGMGEGGSLTMLKWPPGHPDGISAADFGRTPKALGKARGRRRYGICLMRRQRP